MPSAILNIRFGLFEGTHWPIAGPFGIGRHPHNQLELADEKVSRFHAIIEPTQAGFRLRDLDSVNGTWVNGERVKETLLRDGDEIRIGRTLIEFSLAGRLEETQVQQDPQLELKDQVIDLHCHILPGLDDGPQTLEESIEMCNMAFRDGIRTMVAVAHTLNGVHVNDNERILDALEVLKTALRDAEIDLSVLPGSEVHVNPAIPQMVRDKRIMTINQMGRAVMLEFPEFFVPDVMCRFLESLNNEGILTVISHPERTPKFGDPGVLREIIQAGALTQVTAMSVTGGFGPGPKRLARSFLEQGLVHVIATDAHSVRNRPPLLSKAVDEAARTLGMERARALVTHNPFSILRGEYPKAVERAASDEISPAPPQHISVTTSSQTIHSDIAEGVAINEQVASPTPVPFSDQEGDTRTFTISIISNKGGVGKTHFSINLAQAIAQGGTSVLLIDADLGNADISNKLGLFPEHHLRDFLTKELKMEELILKTDFEFDLICGKGGEFQLANLNYGQKVRFAKHFKQTSRSYDFTIFDLGSGIARNTLDFALAADRTVVVTTPDDLLSAYTCTVATFTRFKEIEEKLEDRLPDYEPHCTYAPMVLLNEVNHFEQGSHLYQKFQKMIDHDVNAHEARFSVKSEYLGAIPYDRESFRMAEAKKRPILVELPHIKASQCVKHMSTRFCRPDQPYDPVIKFRYPFRRFVSILSQRV